MSQTKSVIDALFSLFHGGLAADGIGVLLNDALPESIPPAGLIILHDGDPGEPERSLGGFNACYYTHEVPLEIYVQHLDQATRDARYEFLLARLSTLLQSSPTLGGLIAGITYARPSIDIDYIEGAADLKSAVLSLFIEYESPTPLV